MFFFFFFANLIQNYKKIDIFSKKNQYIEIS